MKTITYDETQWKLVPIEPTPEMYIRGGEEFFDAVKGCLYSDDSLKDQNHAASIYLGMLEAAPIPPAGEQAQQDADQVEAQPVAWFAFADNNGPIPLELYGLDEKSCKHAVLAYARADNWKGTVEGYLLRNGWTLRPVYLATAKPDPAMAGDWEMDDAEITRTISNMGYALLLRPGKAIITGDEVRQISKVMLAHKRVQPASGEDARDAARYRYILDCEIKTTLKYLPKLNIEAYKAQRRANHDAAMQQGDR